MGQFGNAVDLAEARMLRTAVRSILQASRQSQALPANAGVRLMSSKVEETDAEFDARFEAYFNRADIDGWEIRKGMHDLSGFDMVPEPKIVAAALRACRRGNDCSPTITKCNFLADPKCREKILYLCIVYDYFSSG